MSELPQNTLNYLVKIRGIFNQYVRDAVAFNDYGPIMPSLNSHPALRPEILPHETLTKHVKSYLKRKWNGAPEADLFKHLDSASSYINQIAGEPYIWDSNRVIAMLTVCYIWRLGLHENGYRRLSSESAADLSDNGTPVKLLRYKRPFLSWDGDRPGMDINHIVALRNPKQVEVSGNVRMSYEIDAIKARTPFYSGKTIIPSLIDDTNYEYMWYYQKVKSKHRV